MHLKISGLLCAALGAAAVHVAAAQTVEESLLKNKVCLGCHQVDSQRVGPPFVAIAQRYAGQPDAVEYLAQSIRGGGRYRWGKLSMAAQPQVSPDEAKQIAQWILTLSPVSGPVKEKP